MYRDLAEMLPTARGISEFVVAMNVDVRDFTSFSNRVESSEAALYLKKVYGKLLRDYFDDSSFAKPTGDGLLIIRSFEEEALKETLVTSVQKAMSVVRNFSTLVEGDPMINFDTPQRVGIGLARGAATCLVSKDGDVIDYSGKPLNLASRLMDLARPEGVVFDESFGFSLLSDDLANLFAEERVYLRGIAPRDPMKVYYTSEITKISTANKQPIEKVRWYRQDDTQTLRMFKKFEEFDYELHKEPLDPDSVQVRIMHESFDRNGRRVPDVSEDYTIPYFEYFIDAGTPKVRLKLGPLRSKLLQEHVKETTEVTIRVEYQVP